MANFRERGRDAWDGVKEEEDEEKQACQLDEI